MSFLNAPLTLDSFAGSWAFRRVVSTVEGVQTAEVRGEVRFDPDGDGGLVSREVGEMRMGPPGNSGPAMQSERVNLWRQNGQRIEVRFEDGRPFHSFDPASTWAEARHECSPDLYLVTYDFGHFPDWRTIWRVTGQRKDYVMTTEYRRP